ncbi:MAG: alpha/beta hydrolase-fold protein [Phycisphaeraceae bacterium]
MRTPSLCRPLLITLLLALPALAQYPADNPRQDLYNSYSEFKNDLLALSTITDAGDRTAAIDTFWNNLRTYGQVPYAQGDRAAFLYRGSASDVGWAGDFNGWRPASGTRIPNTDLWLYERTFAPDSRLDYKVVVNNGSWVLDPANPLQMYSGFGPNSELRMPAYTYPAEANRDPAIPRGTITNNARITSARLGYLVNVRVYTPAGYNENQLANLPTVYVTDGHEYLDDRLGSMSIVLDNLIAQGIIQPVVAVFIDPRDTNSGSNRRADQYVNNPDFVGFLADELVPVIDDNFRTNPAAAARTIMGTSLGGLVSAYVGALRSDTFGNLGIQSPAFWVWPTIYDWYRDLDLTDDLKISMTQGTFEGSHGQTMAGILANSGYDYDFQLTNEGHSWGQWRGLIDDLLIDLVGPPVIPEPTSALPLAAGVAALGSRILTRGSTPARNAGHNDQANPAGSSH